MSIITISNEKRKKLLEGHKDVLTPLANGLETPVCHKCGKLMAAKSPKMFSGLIARYDYECKGCNVFISGSSGVVY